MFATYLLLREISQDVLEFGLLSWVDVVSFTITGAAETEILPQQRKFGALALKVHLRPDRWFKASSDGWV